MRWMVRLVLSVVMLVILGVGVIAMIPAERIAALAVAQFNALTGRELVISGSVRPSFWPQLGVITGPISVSNADWSDQGPMLQAEGLAISVDMAALLGGSVRITGFEAVAPQIVLERSAEGRENWVFGGASGGTVTTRTPGVGAAFTLDRAVLSGASVTFLDHGAGTKLALTGIEAVAAIPDYTGPATVRLSGVLRGQAFDADVTVGAFAPFLDGRLVDLTLVLTAGKARIGFAGRAGHAPLVAEGQLDADLADLHAMMALAGQPTVDLPQGIGAGSVTISAGLTLTAEASVHLRGAVVGLDGNTLRGDADLLTAGERPKLSAQIAAGALSFARASDGSGGGEGGEGWPKDAIDVSGLEAMDAEVGFSADSVDLGAVQVGAVQMLARVERGRAVFDVRRLAAYEGSLAGQFVVNARNGLSVAGDLRASGVAMQPLLTDLAGYDRLIGQGDLELKFLGSGPSVDAILHSLSGSGGLRFGRGALLGLDVAGMIATLDTGYVGVGQKTIFDGVSAGFQIADGILQNDDLRLAAPLITATGAGAVDLGAQRLDYRLKPTLITGEGEGVTVPLVISGRWAAPKITLDLAGLAEEKLAEEAAKLEALARARALELENAARARVAEIEAEARTRLEEELGIVQGTGESLEDAARRRAQEALEEEAARALERLLGGGDLPAPGE